MVIETQEPKGRVRGFASSCWLPLKLFLCALSLGVEYSPPTRETKR